MKDPRDACVVRGRVIVVRHRHRKNRRVRNAISDDLGLKTKVRVWTESNTAKGMVSEEDQENVTHEVELCGCRK